MEDETGNFAALDGIVISDHLGTVSDFTLRKDLLRHIGRDLMRPDGVMIWYVADGPDGWARMKETGENIHQPHSFRGG